MADLNTLKTDAGTIRDASQQNENTAFRIGSWLINLIDFLSEMTADAVITDIIPSVEDDGIDLTFLLKKNDGTTFTSIITLPLADATNAGLMSPQMVHSLGVQANKMSIIGSIMPCIFDGGDKIETSTGKTGIWSIGAHLSDAPKSKQGDVVEYTATEDREIIAVSVPGKYILPYRWFAIFDPNGEILYELACNCIESSYAIVLQKGQTILASCDVYLRPNILDVTMYANAIKNIISAGEYPFEGYINPEGAFVTWNTNYVATDYIPINTSSYIQILNGKSTQSTLLIAFYDENKVFINGIGNATSVYIDSMNIPANAKFIRSSTTKDTVDNTIIINPIPTKELEVQTKEALKTIRKMKDKELPLLFDGYYNFDGSIAINDKSKNTGLVPIDGYDTLEYQVNLSSAAPAVSFWDKNRQVLSNLAIPGDQLTRGSIDLTQSMYAEVKYIALSYYGGAGDYIHYVGLLSNYGSIDARVRNLESQTSLFPTKGDKLNILIFGDSITDCATIEIDKSTNKTTSYALKQKSGNYIGTDGSAVVYDMWPFILTQYIDCFDLRNYAKAGASFKFQERANGLERQNLSYQIDVALNDITNDNGVFPTNGEYTPDIVIFAIGTNDCNPNDTFEDAMSKTILKDDGYTFDVDATLSNLDKTKFCESARYAFLKIKKVFPFALCMCVLPIQTTSRDIQQVGVNAELKKIAERYSIKVIDGASEMGIIRDLETHNGLGVCLKDGLHPNEKGQNLYARLVINAIKNNWIGFDLMN